jgi:hypothetical protein
MNPRSIFKIALPLSARRDTETNDFLKVKPQCSVKGFAWVQIPTESSSLRSTLALGETVSGDGEAGRLCPRTVLQNRQNKQEDK